MFLLVFLVFWFNRLGGDFFCFVLCFLCLFRCLRVLCPSMDSPFCRDPFCWHASALVLSSVPSSAWSQELATPLGKLDSSFHFSPFCLCDLFASVMAFTLLLISWLMLLHAFCMVVVWFYTYMLCHHTCTCHAYTCLLMCCMSSIFTNHDGTTQAHAMYMPFEGMYDACLPYLSVFFSFCTNPKEN